MPLLEPLAIPPRMSARGGRVFLHTRKSFPACEPLYTHAEAHAVPKLGTRARNMKTTKTNKQVACNKPHKQNHNNKVLNNNNGF
jgi:hypothetical protein